MDDSGQNTIVLGPGANRALTAEHVDAASRLIAEAGLLICQMETPLAAVQRTIEIAHAAGHLLLAGCGAMLVTLGPAGLVWAGAHGSHHRLTHAVVALDSTGAGDTFIGALAVALLEKKDLASTIDFAQLAAEFIVQHRGAQASMPTRGDLLTPLGTAGRSTRVLT